MSKIALLTTTFGSGHLQAARAVEHAIRTRRPDTQTKLIDSFTTTAPWLTKLTLQAYLRILAWMPFCYKILYNWGNNSRSALYFRQLVSWRLARSTGRQLAEYGPNAVICTHASPAGAVCQLKREGVLNIPIIAIITDYVVHRLWLYDEVDIYFVAHERVKDDLVRQGIDSKKIIVTGIPVEEKFYAVIDKNAVARQLELSSNDPVILIMGGGTGALPMGEIVSVLREHCSKAQLLVVTGHNDEMRRTVEQAAGDLPVRVFGFVSNIHELMAVSDLVITKPGGLSATEAIIMELPMVIFRPIPGQEEGNANFLLEHGLAYKAEQIADLPRIIGELLYEGKSARQAAVVKSIPRAAETIADIVCKELI